jgi:DNA polymerase-3 subunit delta
MSALYLFTGEATLRRRAIRRLLAELQGDHKEAPPVTYLDAEEIAPRDLLQAIQTPSLFAEHTIIWITHAEQLGGPEPIAQRLAKPLPPQFIIIFEASKLEARGPLYKAITQQGKVRDFPPVDRREMPGLVKQLLQERNVRLSPEGFRYLIEAVSPDLGRLESEIEKLALYAAGRPLTLEELQGLLFADRGGNVFQFIDALVERRPEALRLLQELLDGGEDPNKIFFLIVGQVRALLTVSSLAADSLTSEQIAARTGQFGWLVKRRLEQTKNLSERQLIDWLLVLQAEDARLKRGERDPAEALFQITLIVLGLTVPASA